VRSGLGPGGCVAAPERPDETRPFARLQARNGHLFRSSAQASCSAGWQLDRPRRRASRSPATPVNLNLELGGRRTGCGCGGRVGSCIRAASLAAAQRASETRRLREIERGAWGALISAAAAAAAADCRASRRKLARKAGHGASLPAVSAGSRAEFLSRLPAAPGADVAAARPFAWLAGRGEQRAALIVRAESARSGGGGDQCCWPAQAASRHRRWSGERLGVA